MNIEIGYVILYSYLLGSVPYGLILTKLYLNKDLRSIGSGNIGATNALRTGNKVLGILTFILDLLKGFVSVFITYKFYPDLIYLSGLSCIFGHIFSIWLKFKGGKGVSTYLGVLIQINFFLATFFIISWIIIFSISKFSSLSSLLSSILVLIVNIYFYGFYESINLFIFFITLVFTHKKNIELLLYGKENKF